MFWGGSRGRGRNWTLGPALAYVTQLPELPLSVANVFGECTSLSRLSEACWFPDDVTAPCLCSFLALAWFLSSLQSRVFIVVVLG